MARAGCASDISWRGITLRSENDSFAKTDRNYSNGLALMADSHDLENFSVSDCLPLLGSLTPDFWIHEDNLMTSSNLVFKAGQSIFTPRNFVTPDIVLNDRPYAGLLYAGLSLHQRHSHPETNLEFFDAREITIGVIGPLSFAKEFQDNAHDLLGDERFQGWKNQLSNEPAFQIAFDKKFKEYQSGLSVLHGFAHDLIYSTGARLGNIETSANIGIEGRIGYDIPNDFGSFTIRPGTESRPPDIVATENPNLVQFGFHFFTLIDLRYVAYNFSVDGNLFHPSHRVTRQPWVTFAAAGFAFPTVIRKRKYNLALMQVYQSPDFREQDSHHAYRSIALSIEF